VAAAARFQNARGNRRWHHGDSHRAARHAARARRRRAARDHLLDALAALSHQASFSLGCYCEDEHRCHRSVLRELLTERGAAIE